MHVLLDRTTIAELSQDMADGLYQWLASTLRAAMAAHTKDSQDGVILRRRTLERLPEFMSRIVLRVSDHLVSDAFELTRTMHAHDFYRDHLGHKALGEMWKNLFIAASEQKLRDWLEFVLMLDIPHESNDVWMQFFPEPSNNFQDVTVQPPKSLVISMTWNQWRSVIDRRRRM